MAQTFRVSVAGGIDAVTDLTLSDRSQSHVLYMENLDVRSGKAVPYKIPLVDPNIVPPADSVQVFSYRGRLIFNAPGRRSYVAQFQDGRERICWTQYGGNPMKMIDGTVVSLGTIQPASPTVSVGEAIAPQNVILTVVPGGGALPAGKVVSFRLAYNTAQGVMPASGAVLTTIATGGSSIILTWSNPETTIPVMEIWVFVGNGAGDEQFVAAFAAKATEYQYPNVIAPSGALAKSYDQTLTYQYCVTYLRNVNGVEDESAPSAPTPPYQSTLSRNVAFDPWSEGLMDSGNLVTWGPNQPPFQLLSPDVLPGSNTSPLTVSSIVQIATGQVVATFTASHTFYDGEMIFIAGLVPDPFNGLAIQVQVDDPAVNGDAMFTSVGLVVDDSFVAPGTGLTGVTAYRVPFVGVKAMGYNPETGSVEVWTNSPHTFGTEKVRVVGLNNDPAWNSADGVDVIGDPNNASRFFAPTMSLPIGITGITGGSGVTGVTGGTGLTGGTGAMFAVVSKMLTGMMYELGSGALVHSATAENQYGTNIPVDYATVTGTGVSGATGPQGAGIDAAITYFSGVGASGPTGATGVCPVLGDILYFDMVVSGVSGTTSVQMPARVVATPAGGVMVNQAVNFGAGALEGPIYSGASGASNAAGVSFIPYNDFIQARRLYRGEPGGFQLAAELPLETTSFLDGVPDSGLGDVLPTLFTDQGIDIEGLPPTFGLAGLTMHNNQAWAWDPSSNRVVCSIPGSLDAWPPNLYWDFQYRVLALLSYNAALCVFCEDRVYRIDGTFPIFTKNDSKAGGCRAGGSVQVVNNRAIYLTDQGLSEFDGQESRPLTDKKIPAEFWLAGSAYLLPNTAAGPNLTGGGPGQYLVPFVQNAAWQRLAGESLAGTPRSIQPYQIDPRQYVEIQKGLRSFVLYGKYFLYWGADYPQYAAQTMVCVDFSAPGEPASVIGVKAMDVFVDEVNQVHMLLTENKPVTTSVIITSPLNGAEYLLGEPITYTCVPSTPGYQVSDHTCTWVFDDGATAVGVSVSKTWTELGDHSATVTAVCNPIGTSASASVTVDNILPGALGTTLYNLAVDLTYYPSSYTAEVQRRDVLDPTNHTFQTFAKIPTSILDLVSTETTVFKMAKDLFGMQIINGQIYLIVNPVTIGGVYSDSNRNTMTDARIYVLSSVGAGNVGNWTEVASDTLPYTVGSTTGMVYGSGTWGGGNISWEYSHGAFQISNVVNTRVVTGPFTVNDNQTLVTYEFMSPYFIGPNGTPTRFKPTCTEQAQFVINDGYDNIVQAYGGSVHDDLGYSVNIAPNTTAYILNGNEYPVVSGTLMDLTSINFFAPYTYNSSGSVFGVVTFTLDTWVSVEGDPIYGRTPPTSTQNAYMDNTGAIHPLTLPATNGNDSLAGVLGVNAVGIYRKGESGGTPIPLFTYSNFYVAPAGNLSEQYSIFSALGSDGSIYHIENIEAATPTYYRDGTLLANLNGG